MAMANQHHAVGSLYCSESLNLKLRVARQVEIRMRPKTWCRTPTCGC